MIVSKSISLLVSHGCAIIARISGAQALAGFLIDCYRVYKANDPFSGSES
jgi:hypothetical protein